ncbi:MAG: type II secretion system protein [Cyanobacteria bacterium P01_G01_bin.39]
MKNKEFHKLLKKNKSNSGFTLTELLVGLIMSVFVIGALGFGLMQVLQLTQKGNSETAARNESSRALDFISDEMRRAQTIEVDMSDKHITENVATSYTKPSGGTIRLALQIPGVEQRVIYSVANPEEVDSDSPWKGPRAIYRWGPDFDANGNYSNADNPAVWDNDVLVDGISAQDQTASCDGSDVTYQGFFACVVDDDGDGIVENAADSDNDTFITFADDPNDRNDDGEINFGDTLTDGLDAGSDVTFADSDWDKNKDGIINADDAADIDGLAITAQLYFTGETKGTTKYNASSYSADTKTVARARTAPDNNANNFGNSITSRREFDSKFACSDSVEWQMRTDFGDSISNPSNLEKSQHDGDIASSDDKQPQPISLDGDTLVITSIPIGVGSSANCLNSREGNGHGSTTTQDFAGNKSMGDTVNWDTDWHSDPNNDIVAISHVINFNDPRTFNGDPSSCTGYPCSGSAGGKVYTKQDNAPAKENEYVLVLKEGTELPALNGYDMNDDNDIDDPGEQVSLGEFLASEGYATLVGSVYKIDGLDNDQRIIAFEIGKSDTSDKTAPGVDFQDNVFMLQSDAFSQKYKTYEDNYNNSSPYAPPSYNVLN